MACEARRFRTSIIHCLDPRLRILAAVVFSVLMVSIDRFATLETGLAIGIVLVMAARLPAVTVMKRLAMLNVFMALLSAVLPLTTPGTAVAQWGPLTFSREGTLQACSIALKSNAIVLALTALVGTIEMVTLGHALQHLWVPRKLVHLFLLTVRYIDVFRGEYQRLARAMKVRGFRPRADGHSLRALGYLVGMLLVRSLDRSERILAAMKCRGFRGRFFLLDHFTFARRDLVFAATCAAACAALIWMEMS